MLPFSLSFLIFSSSLLLSSKLANSVSDILRKLD